MVENESLGILQSRKNISNWDTFLYFTFLPKILILVSEALNVGEWDMFYSDSDRSTDIQPGILN